MVMHLVINVMADDRPGLVDRISEAISRGGGNWCESRMAHLAEQFAGIIRVELQDDENAEALKDSLAELSADGIQVTVVEARSHRPSTGVGLTIGIVGPDQPGIVQEITSCFTRHAISIEAMETDTESAPMGGGTIFRAKFELSGPADFDQEALGGDLERIADALIVDLDIMPSDDAT